MLNKTGLIPTTQIKKITHTHARAHTRTYAHTCMHAHTQLLKTSYKTELNGLGLIVLNKTFHFFLYSLEDSYGEHGTDLRSTDGYRGHWSSLSSTAFDGGELMGPLWEMLPFFGFCFSMLCLLVFLHFFATNYKLNISDKFRGVQGFT